MASFLLIVMLGLLFGCAGQSLQKPVSFGNSLFPDTDHRIEQFNGLGSYAARGQPLDFQREMLDHRLEMERWWSCPDPRSC